MRRSLTRVAFLRKTQGTIFPAHYTENIPLSGEDRLLCVADDMCLAGTQMWLRNVKGAITYGCSAKVKNGITGLDGLFADAKVFLAACGSRSISAFVWDLVPFSFVVDWVFNVSGLLERYAAIESFKGELQIVSAGTSFKKVFSGDLSLEGSALTNGSMKWGSVKISQYDRQAGLDCGVNVFGPLSDLSSKQLTILTALLGQRA